MTDTLVAFDDVLASYDPALGLEVHVELNTNTKMFCGCPAFFGGEPNTHVCPTCLGLPGAMPVVNKVAVESAMRHGAVGARMTGGGFGGAAIAVVAIDAADAIAAAVTEDFIAAGFGAPRCFTVTPSDGAHRDL